jgi:two-component sensor histidine kinase
LKQLFVNFVILFSLQLHAQEYVITLKHWGVEEGLSHRHVYGVYQDSKGFVWVTTPNALNRFDGYNFTWYTHEKDALPRNDIISVAEDVYGRLWCVGGGARDKNNTFLFNPYTKKIVTSDSLKIPYDEQQAFAVHSLRDSSILILLSGVVSNSFTWHPRRGFRKTGNGLNHQAVYLPDEEALLYLDDSRRLVLLSPDGQVLKEGGVLPPGDTVPDGYFLNGGYVRSADGSRSVYITGGLQVVDSGVFIPPKESGPDYMFNTGIDGIVCRQGRLYHPKYGLLRDFIKDGFEGLRSNAIVTVEDRFCKGRFWISTEFGLYMLTISRSKFKQYFKESGKYVLGANSYRGIVADDSNVYGCNEIRGILKAGKETRKAYKPLLSTDGSALNYGLVRLADGSIEAAIGNALVNARPGKDGPAWHLLPPLYGGYWSMYEYAPGRLLLGSYSGLRWVLPAGGIDSAFTLYHQFSEVAQSLTLFIAPDRSGQLWLCCDRGFYMLDTLHGITARYSRADTGNHFLPSYAFQHYYQDSEGIYWLATVDGLIRWDRAHNISKLYTRSDGLSNENIHAVYADDYGKLWLSSDYGIMEFNKATGAVKAYLEGDGVTYNEFNRLSHYKDKEGNIYFGSLNGITAFNPKDFVTGSGENKSALALTAFRQFNGESNVLEDRLGDVVATNTINIFPNDRFFNLEFSLLNFSDPEHTLYYWKIDGIDTGWNIQKDRNLRLSRLPYDQHTLRIKAQAADGSWSRNDLVIAINVVRPFYMRLWFLIASVVAIIILIITGYRWRLYLLRRENERLDRLVTEKTEGLRISLQQKEVLLKEIHHRVKNNLQVISSLLRLQSHSVKDEAAKNALLEGQNRVLSIALIHQKLYQHEHLDEVEFSDFADELFGQLKGVFRKPDTEINFINETGETFIGIDIAVPLGLILNELITNSFKYAFGGRAEVWLKLKMAREGNAYVLTYSDSGPGLPGNIDMERSSTLGLRLINRLSKQLNGSAVYVNNEFIVRFQAGMDNS